MSLILLHAYQNFANMRYLHFEIKSSFLQQNMINTYQGVHFFQIEKRHRIKISLFFM